MPSFMSISGRAQELFRKKTRGGGGDTPPRRLRVNAFGILAFISRFQQHNQSRHRNKNLSTSRSSVKTDR